MTLSDEAVERAALLPCPFCGGTRVRSVAYAGKHEPDEPKWWTGCSPCEAGIDTQTEAEGIAAWNTRAALEASGLVDQSEQIKALESKLATAGEAIEHELAMSALANVEASTEWIDGFEFAWKRTRAALDAIKEKNGGA